jgi:hypothetical protein
MRVNARSSSICTMRGKKSQLRVSIQWHFNSIFTSARSPLCYSSKRASQHSPSKAVDVAITAPTPKGLALVVEEESEQTPQRHETHVGHYRRHETGLHDPRRDESTNETMVSCHCFASSTSRWSVRTYSAKPYPHKFLFTVMATMSGPATGLYESTA